MTAADRLALHHARGTWFDPQARQTVDQNAVIARAARSRAVLLGETHDIAEIHRWQLHVAVALHAVQPKLAIGFEMFPRRVQPALDAWVEGKLTTEEFLVAAEWYDVWGFDPELYLPLFHFCRQQCVPMLALNCERSLVRRVRQEGWAAIPVAERDGLTPSKPATEAYRHYLGALLSGGANPISDGFVAAQQVWDRAFACNIAQALAAGTAPLILGIIGRGHLEFGHGTPYQLRDLGIDRISVLLPTGPDAPGRDLAPAIADAVFKLDRPEERQPRAFKLGITWQGDALIVAKTEEESVARAIGLEAGDRLRRVAGQKVTRLSELMAILRRAQGGSLLPLTILRDRAETEILLSVPHAKPFGGSS